MNKKLLQKIVNNKELLVPSLFTEKQVLLIEKYLKKEKLTNTEKTYFYSVIKKKITALSAFEEEFYVRGKKMISSRVKEAKQILIELKKQGYNQAFISGSFLFKEKYDDIDIFIISKKRKQHSKKKKHFIQITKKDLNKVIFASAASYCVSNFEIINKVEINRTSLDDNFLSHQVTLNELSENEEPKTLKYLIIEYNLLIKNKLLDSYELYQEYQRIINDKNRINIINSLVKEIIINGYSKSYCYNVLGRFSKNLEKQILTYTNNNNLIVCKKLVDEIKNECRRAKA